MPAKNVYSYLFIPLIIFTIFSVKYCSNHVAYQRNMQQIDDGCSCGCESPEDNEGVGIPRSIDPLWKGSTRHR